MSAARLEIRVLGELSVRRGAEALGLPASRKTRALLGLLVAARAPLSRTHLCELLWEGPVDPRAELRWSLNKVRALLGGADRLRAEGDALALAPGAGWIDLVDVERLAAGGLETLASEPLAQALGLFRGELLAGLELPDCFRYHSWLLAERERLTALRLAMFERLFALELATPSRALATARAWVAADPLAEAAHAAVVRSLLALGRPREANQAAETCRRILRQELGVAPGALLEAAREERPRPSGARATPEAREPGRTEAAPSATPARPFVGRDAELARGRAAVAAAFARRSPCVLLARGEPGIGKSRLLAELARAVEDGGGTALAARGFEAELTRPFGVWIDLLRAGLPAELRAGLAGDLAPLLPELGGEGRPAIHAGDPLDRERLHGAVSSALATLAARGAGLLLIFDDLQWIDEASIALLHAALDRLPRAALATALGARAGELAPNGPGARLLRDLERGARLTRLDLGPLAEGECVALARSVNAAADAPRVARASGGNPLFAIELARSAGDWDRNLPASLNALVGERLARLGEGARALATWAAVVGTSFAAGELADLAALPRDAFLAALEELERAALFRPSRDGERYDFVHDLVRRTAYEQIPPPRRRFLHAAVARALGARPDPEAALAADLARHAALGGESELAARACLAAADRCLRLAAVEEAAELGERGLGHLARSDPGATLGLRFELLRALLHATQGRPRRAGMLAEVGRWVDEARRIGRPEHLQLGLYVLGVISYGEGDFSAAERQVLEEAEALRGAEPRIAARALSNAGRCLAQIERDHARAEALLREGRDLAARAGLELLDIPWGLGMLAQAAGRVDEARRELGRAVEIAHRAGDPWTESQCLARLAAMAFEADEPATVLDCCRELEALTAKVGEGSEGAIAAGLRALVAARREEPGAEAELGRAIGSLRAADSKLHLAFVLNHAALRDLEANRRERAAERAAEALAAAAAVGRRGQVARARWLLARIALAGGDRAGARRELRAAVEQNRAPGTLGGRTWGEIEELARRLRIPTLAPTPRRQARHSSRGGRP
ncbi:MAG: AAA family ATPase [Thermoanaerobaculia bacterium]